MQNRNSFLGLTPQDWRIIGISLSILSLGLTIAWLGLAYVTQKKQNSNITQPTPSPAPKISH